MSSYSLGQGAPAEEKPIVCLPSSNSAYALIKGLPGSYTSLMVHFVGRSAIIGTGLALAGYRKRDLVVGSLVCAGVLEASLLIWAMFEKRPPEIAPEPETEPEPE